MRSAVARSQRPEPLDQSETNTPSTALAADGGQGRVNSKRAAVPSPPPIISGFNGSRLPHVVSKGAWKGVRLFEIKADQVQEDRLWRELSALRAALPGGFAIRLNCPVSTIEHVQMWERAMAEFPALHLFGFDVAIENDRPADVTMVDLLLRMWRRFDVRLVAKVESKPANDGE